MPIDHNSSGRRPHYHRGRRGTDRRGSERRTPPSEQSNRPSGDQTDVEQIMREIRSRISQRGIDLSPQQIQDLAARRLEAILDPRTINPTLFDQLRKGASVAPDPATPAADAEYTIADDAIYQGSGAIRFFRRLFSPLRKMLFDPAPLIAALQKQVRINHDAATRAAELERRQTEWNALHYQILQRLVTEVSRASIEMQSLTTRIEALAARVDFNDRRVRAMESAPPPARSPRPQETAAPAAAPAAPSPTAATETAPAPAVSASTGDAPRRRRRRRRGRRGASQPGTADAALAATAAAGLAAPDEGADLDEGDEEEGPDGPDDADAVTAAPSFSDAPVAPIEQQTSPEPPPVEPPAPLIPEAIEQVVAAQPAPALNDKPPTLPGATDQPDPPAPPPFVPTDPGNPER